MALRSMTGFGSAGGNCQGARWHWEVRTVNGRGLDLRVRLPGGFESLEPTIREACAVYLRRGNCSVSLQLKREAALQIVKLNEGTLTNVIEAMRKAQEICEAAPPRLDGILALKGVLEYSDLEESEKTIEQRSEEMLATLDKALKEVDTARAKEGQHLATVVNKLIAKIEALVLSIDQTDARSPTKVEERLKDQVSRLCRNGPELDPVRLHIEAVLLATKADIQEEIDRLRAHVAGARELLTKKDTVGRRLDFLAQEFNREANTICSKSNDVEITRHGLELKAVIDQMREQVQNIE